MSDAGTPHELVSPDTMVAARGFSHAVVAAPGNTVYVAGQIGVTSDGDIVGETFVEQFDAALANVVAALHAAGARPEHVVSVIVYTTVVDEYRAGLRAIGAVWREHFGRHFPAMALLGVTELVVPAAVVEVVATAVIPQDIGP